MKSRTHGVNVPGAVLITNETGPPDGRCVLLSHPLMMGTATFRPLTELLAARGYRVVTWDHRGQGANCPTRGRPEVNLSVLTSDAVEIIKSMRLHRPHVVGQGMGGMVALRLAAWCPRDLVASVTAIGATVEAEHHREPVHRLADHIEKHGVAGEVDLGWGKVPVVNILVRISFGTWTRRHHPTLAAAWMQRYSELSHIAPSIRAFAERDNIVGDLLRQCDIPVLAVAGAEDILFPPAVSGEAIAHATGGRTVTIDRAGHSAALEQPEAVMSHLEEHFAAADRVDAH